MSEYEGLRKSDRIIVEELYQAVLDAIFNPIQPHLRKGITKEEIADLVVPWEVEYPWPETDTRVVRLKEMYGATAQEIMEGTGICEADGKPTLGFKEQILSRVDAIHKKCQ